MSLDKRTWIDALLLVFVAIATYILAQFVQDWLNLPPEQPQPVSSPVPRSQSMTVLMEVTPEIPWRPDAPIPPQDVPYNPHCVNKHGRARVGEGFIRYIHSVLTDLVDIYDEVDRLRVAHPDWDEHVVDRYPDLDNDYLCWMSPSMQWIARHVAEEILYIDSEVAPQTYDSDMNPAKHPRSRI